MNNEMSNEPKVEEPLVEEPLVEVRQNGTVREKKKSLREKLKDPAYKKRVLLSLFHCFAFLTLGIGVGLQGPTFLDIQIITNTDVESASFFFTSGSTGYMLGSMISGVIHGKINNNLLMATSSIGMGIFTLLTPYCSDYILMLVIKFATALTFGGIDTLGNAEHMRLWGTDGEEILQLLHTTFAVGGMISPLYTEPFLAPKEIKTTSNGIDNSTHFNVTGNQNVTEALNGTSTLPRTTQVHYAFIITAVICVVMGLPFLVMYFLDRKTSTSDDEKYQQHASCREIPISLYCFLVGLLCFFYFLYCCVEDTFASFLMTFLVKQYDHVSKSKGAYITTFYWGSFAVSRFLCVFISKVLRAVRMLYLFTTLMILAYGGFAIFAFLGYVDVLTFFSGLAGLAMSSVFPSGFSWTETELMKVTGRISAGILIGSSMGMMVNPVLIGFLMKEVSNMWFCYVLVIETAGMCAVFYFLLTFNRCYVNSKYGSLKEVRSVPVPSTEPRTENIQNEDL